MSNFICSECGMNNIDCGYAGYKTPKEIELEKKVHILNEANMKLENELGHFAEVNKKVKVLRELLEQALQTMGQISKLSDNKVDAIQCANTICLIEERLKEMEGVK